MITVDFLSQIIYLAIAHATGLAVLHTAWELSLPGTLDTEVAAVGGYWHEIILPGTPGYSVGTDLLDLYAELLGR